MKKISILIAPVLWALTNYAQSFTPGNIAVLVAANANNTTGSIIELNTTTSGQSPVNTYNISGTGANALRFSGSAGTTCYLSNNYDGTLLTFTGANNTNTSSNVNTLNPRGVGTFNPSGTFNLATTYSATSGNQTRCATSLNNTNWFIADQGGLYSNGTSTASPSGNIKSVKPFGAVVYVGSASLSSQVNTISTPTGGSFTGLPGLSSNANFDDFYLISSGSNGSTYDVLYVISATSATAGTISKFSLVAGTWTANGTYTTSFGGLGLIASKSGSGAFLYVTGGNGATVSTSVIKLADLAGYNTAINIITGNNISLFTTSSSLVLKGIAFAPVDLAVPPVNLAVSTNSASEAGATVVTVSATISSKVLTNQTVTLTVSGTDITNGDYTLSNTTITIPAGSNSGSVTFTIIDDIIPEGTETALLTISNPSSGIVLGVTTTQNITIVDNDNFPPTIVMNVASTSDFIDGAASTSPPSPYTVSGTISDPTDPASTLGINFTINDVETPVNSLTVSVTSSNTAVVPAANLNLTGSGASRNLKITPFAVGYSNITLTVSDGISTASYSIAYAASAAAAIPANTVWHTGMSDASDAIAIDDNYYISGDDEINVLNVYSRSASGLPLVSYNYSSNLNLPDPNKPEADLEAATKSTTNSNKIYWLGSMSNGKDPFDDKPNRNRIFATTISGTGAGTTFTFAGYYGNLRAKLIAWGNANGYNFSASAAAGVDSKAINGFAAEGMVFGPDNTTLYIGMRAPLVPIVNRTKAVIAPILNFESWFNNGAPIGDPTFGSPIELDLGNRGIRDLIKLSNGTFVILAGNYGSDPIIGAIFTWTGNATDAPVLIVSPNSTSLNMEGALQVNEVGQLSLNKLQVVTDKGGDILYGDGFEAKDFGDLNLRKFRLDNLSSLDLSLCPTITCPSNIIDFAVFENCGKVISYSVNVLQSCSGVTLSQIDGTGLTSGQVFPVGTTMQTWKASIASGNTSTCSFNITIKDNQNPIITGCPSNIIKNADPGVCNSIVSWIEPTASDNCPGVSFTSNFAPGSAFSKGVNTITYTATDASNNKNTCAFTVTVNDNQLPVILGCPANISANMDPNQCFATVSWNAPTATDNCSISSFTSNKSPGSTFPVGINTVTYTATDISNNSKTCSFTVSVTDNQLPVATCPGNLSRNTTSGICKYTTIDGEFNANATDNCGITAQLAYTLTGVTMGTGVSTLSGLQLNKGLTTIQWKATDVNNNIGSCTFTVMVQDNELPKIICPADIPVITLPGQCVVTGLVIGSPTGVTDNCGILSTTNNGLSSYPVGVTTVIWKVTDVNGNSASCNQKITVTPYSCGAPTQVLHTDTTSNSAKVKWKAGKCATTHELRIRQELSPGVWGAWSGWLTSSGALEHLYTGLQSSTFFNYQIRSNCGGTFSGSINDWFHTFPPPFAKLQDRISIEENNSEMDELPTKLEFVPNPAQDYSTILIEGFEHHSKTVTMFDLYGKLVFRVKVDAKQNQMELDLTTLGMHTGVYMIRVSDERKQKTEQLMIER